ncbi:hypothetical protein [Luteolibacter soli]|uniref:Uncharacterized protein n=1 Tax=Luteolibacter soli TaxID=3135280 RepID=A0ABU9AZV6_9BACT
MRWKPVLDPAEEVPTIKSIAAGVADLQKRLEHLERSQRCRRAPGPSPAVRELGAPETLDVDGRRSGSDDLT